MRHGDETRVLTPKIMLRPSGAIGLGGSDAWVIPVTQATEIAALEGVRTAVSNRTNY